MLQRDCTRRFLFENIGIRGQWVNLTDSWQAAKQHQPCHHGLELQLGQALSAGVLLGATIKFNGSLILQTQGTGILKTLVVQATHDRHIRGLIRFDSVLYEPTKTKLFGDGRLILTVNITDGKPYQGIVPIRGDNLAGAIENYFVQSEQLKTRLWLTANASQAAGLLIQQLPSENDDHAWERIALLANTLTDAELIEVDCETLLYRLFNEEKVRVFEPEPVTFSCSCSRAKIQNTLRLLGRHEIENILAEQGHIEVNCEFCNKHYQFDAIDTQELWLPQNNFSENSTTQH